MTNQGNPSSAITQSVRDNWVWFLILGIVLIIGGLFAIAAPLASSIAVALVLAIVLAVGGVVQIFQAFKVQSWSGFFWQLIVGLAALLGGIAVYAHPMVGTLALTLVVAIVFLVQGIFQLLLGLKLRPRDGWGWIIAAGVISLLAALMIFTRFPVSGTYVLGILAGISITFNGWSYIAIALAAKNAGNTA